MFSTFDNFPCPSILNDTGIKIQQDEKRREKEAAAHIQSDCRVPPYRLLSEIWHNVTSVMIMKPIKMGMAAN